MGDHALGGPRPIDVAVIGAGPAGLAAATELKRCGVARVVLLERESRAGGIPRHCGHHAFGMQEFRRVLRGPDYAARLVAGAVRAGVEIHLSTTVVEARPGARLLITGSRGAEEISARRVVYSTGLREMARSARLISGTRPTTGVINTGALQSMVYLKKRKPFERPVIVGTELVAFSAIMTCRHAGIRPVAMLEPNRQVSARWPYSPFARLMGFPVHLGTRLLARLSGSRLHLGTRLVAIRGTGRVEAVEVEDADGQRRVIDCDGVILTGRFTPEASLALCGHLAVDPATGGPVVDQYGRCSDPAYFATGNLLRPAETAGWCWGEGGRTGRWVAGDLAGNLAVGTQEVQIAVDSPLIRFAMPQKIMLPQAGTGMESLQLGFSRPARGTLSAQNAMATIWEKRLRVHPQSRVLVPLNDLVRGAGGGRIELLFRQAGD